MLKKILPSKVKYCLLISQSFFPTFLYIMIFLWSAGFTDLSIVIIITVWIVFLIIVSLYLNRAIILYGRNRLNGFFLTLIILLVSILIAGGYLLYLKLYLRLIKFLGFLVLTLLINIMMLHHFSIIIQSRLSDLTESLATLCEWTVEPGILNKDIKRYLKDRQVHITMLFGDIRGFSEFSKKHPAYKVKQMLDGFYRLVEKIVINFGGQAPEFIADEFITYFRHPKQAIDCAYVLQWRLKEYLKTYGLGLGIGIHKGKVILGFLGGSISKRYTILGHAVNLTERLQSIAGPGEIVVSDSLKNYLKSPNKQKIMCNLKGVGEVKAYKLNL